MSNLSRWMSASALVMLSLCLLPTTTQAQGRAKKPSGVQCAKESGRCAFSGEGAVYYGADSRWFVKRGQNGMDCNNATFGDPTPGVAKSCYVKLNTPVIALKGHHGSFVVAEADGTANANRKAAGPWEKWTLQTNSDGTVSLKSHHGKYLVAEGDGKLNANRTTVGPWERFTLVKH